MKAIRKVSAAVVLGALVLLLGPVPSADAQFDTDTYLCDELGIGCPVVSGNLVCTTPLAPGDTGTCTLTGAEPGTEVEATITCGSQSTVVFQGTVDADPFTFDFTVPNDAPLGTCTVSVLGETFALTIATGGSTLPRTGSNFGSQVGLAASLLVIGGSAVLGARSRRRRQAETV